MTDLSPSHRALRLCIALALASAGLSLLLVTIPRGMLAPQPPLFQFEGLAWQIVQAATLGISLMAMLLAALLPQAVPSAASGGVARALAHGATLLVALIALASIWLAARPALEQAAAQAYLTQVVVQSVASLIGIAGPLAVIAALAARLPRPGPRAAALVLLAVLMLADVALTAGLSPLPTGGLLLALLLGTALTLHRRAQLPAATPPWLISLAALWSLPWAVASLPQAGAALMISDTSQRFPALAEALFTSAPAHQLVGPLPTLICLGALASLLFAAPGKRAVTACAALLGIVALLPHIADAIGYAPFGPATTLDLLRSGGIGAGAALTSFLAWCAVMIQAPVMAFAAAWLWLRATRRPL